MPVASLCYAVDVYFCTVGLPILASLVVLALHELRDEQRDPWHPDGPRPSPRYSYSARPASSSSCSSTSSSFAQHNRPRHHHHHHHHHHTTANDSTTVSPPSPTTDNINNINYNNNDTSAVVADTTTANMVADALVYHPTMAHLLKFTSTVTGRDKVLRTLQYFARFYAWYLLRTNGTKGEIAPWETMKKQFGTTRKLLRVGKNLEHIKAAAVAADSKTLDPVLRYLAVGRQLGYAGYLSLDMATVLNATGIRKWEGAKRAQQEAFRFWAIGLMCSAISQVYTQYKLRERESRISLKDGEGVVEKKKIEKERVASQLQLFTDLCDLTAPASALAWANFDDGFVGLAGTMSSLIGIWSQWQKTA
ncbi:Peroxisomal biogenesis factor 11 (PEX11) [Microdochium nivale]|nr:Peroxisomal biogenesis factor 11 (PEX11) [Microdochium nivale]